MTETMAKHKPQISLIVAMTADQVIGYQGKMPWYLPADLAYFKQQTLHKPIVMGHTTYRAIGKALPLRDNIVLSRQADLSLVDASVITQPDSLLQRQEAEIMIIGGAQIYQLFLPLADVLYITWIEAQIKGDTYFPDITWADWQLTKQNKQSADQKNGYDLRFCCYQRQ